MLPLLNKEVHHDKQINMIDATDNYLWGIESPALLKKVEYEDLPYIYLEGIVRKGALHWQVEKAFLKGFLEGGDKSDLIIS